MIGCMELCGASVLLGCVCFTADYEQRMKELRAEVSPRGGLQ